MGLDEVGTVDVGFGFRNCVAEGPWRPFVHALIGEMDMDLWY